ncbi:hypothetical protein [Siccirubricoccus sp. G192]|nr:hypothetical protein [Siccirubricoccus sp. G192]
MHDLILPALPFAGFLIAWAVVRGKAGDDAVMTSVMLAVHRPR